MIVSILQVSHKNQFSRYTCIPSHYLDNFTPLPHDHRRHRPFSQIRQLTHISANTLIGFLDGVGWEGEEDLEEEGGGGVLRRHHVIWEVGDKFHGRLRALIHTGGPFQSVNLFVFDLLLLLFHLPVMRNKYALILHLWSDIYPSWGVRFHYDSFFISIPVWHHYHYNLPRFHLSCLDLLNGENCTLFDSIISWHPNKEVPWWYPIALRMTIGSVVLMSLTYPGAIESLAIYLFPSDFSLMVFGLLLDILGRWCHYQVGKGAGSFFKGVNDDRGWLLLKQIPHLHNKIIHVFRSKFHGSMMSLPFKFCYDIIYLQLEVGPIIIGTVVGGVSGLEDKWGDVVGSEKTCGPIIEVDVMAIKGEDLWIELASSTGPTEENHCLHPGTPINTSWWYVVD